MLNDFISISETEGIPLNIVEDHVGQAVWEVYGLNYGTDEPWDMTDKIQEAIEQCYDIADDQSAADAHTVDLHTQEDVLTAMNNILKW